MTKVVPAFLESWSPRRGSRYVANQCHVSPFSLNVIFDVVDLHRENHHDHTWICVCAAHLRLFTYYNHHILSKRANILMKQG